MKTTSLGFTRRDFLGTLTAGSLGLVSTLPVMGKSITPGPDQAPDGPVLKAGLIGCGGRGRGAAGNFIDAGPHLRITALADVFPDRIEEARRVLKKSYGQEVADSRCFVGFDAYLKLIDSGVDLVLHATPPHFRPLHFEAAVAAGKHVFLEKPVAVDPVGVRSVLETAAKAREKGLSVMTGTQLRRDQGRIETYNRVRDGAIGDVLAVQCFRNQGGLWYRLPQKGWSDMEYMIRDWVNWCWLSGDHIVEQHIHELDQIVWFTGSHPVQAMGMGGRARRVTGDQFDYFSIDYEFESGVHMHSMTRQVNGCANARRQVLAGTRGACDCSGVIYDHQGNVLWKYEDPKDRPKSNPVVQEHVDWVTAIRRDEPVSAAEETSISTLVAIMGRESAYTGRLVTWDEMMSSQLRLGPTEYAMGAVDIKAKIPVPGSEETPPPRA